MSARRRPELLAVLALVLASSAPGCAAKTAAESVDAESEALAEDGTDTTSAESDSETMVTSFLSATAVALADSPSGFYRPAGCLSVSEAADASAAAGSTTVTLDDCTGPLGLLTISGAVAISWNAPSSAELDLTISAVEPVQFKRATVSTWTASATIVQSGVRRTMTWNATLAGTTARARPFARTVAKTLTWTLGGACVTVSGAADGQVAGRDLKTTVTGYERCGGCPQSGSIVETNGSTGHTITLAFDGSDEATFTAADGVTSEIALECTP